MYQEEQDKQGKNQGKKHNLNKTQEDKELTCNRNHWNPATVLSGETRDTYNPLTGNRRMQRLSTANPFWKHSSRHTPSYSISLYLAIIHNLSYDNTIYVFVLLCSSTYHLMSFVNPPTAYWSWIDIPLPAVSLENTEKVVHIHTDIHTLYINP